MEEAARLVIVLLAAALVINLILGGPERVRAWIAAKFLGKTNPKFVGPT